MDDMDQRFSEALTKGDCHTSLLALARDLKREGVDQRGIYQLFSNRQQSMSADDARYDAVVDTMDLIESGPWAKGKGLFDTQFKTDA
jgi:hypothetical protein